ncbi:30S ribosomal protein S3 [Candidatus Woesearchaeota archaeon]|nr:MAG: 30S ribosomal protein S3 [Candidatus Woesearchaeota archaeon]
MIERQIVGANVKEFRIREFIESSLRNLGLSDAKLQKTPLGEKIIIYASRPGLIVGRGGENIKRLTKELKENFDLENPQIEIAEVENPDLDAAVVAEKIANSLEKFGSQRFKGIGYRVMTDSMNAGAMGIEILISGKIPSSRAKTWRFYMGYLKKSGDIALTGVDTHYSEAHLKTGTVGIQVRIMPPSVVLPDKIEIFDEPQIIIEDVSEKESTKKASKKTVKKAKKKTAEKKAKTKEESKKKETAKNKKSDEIEAKNTQDSVESKETVEKEPSSSEESQKESQETKKSEESSEQPEGSKSSESSESSDSKESNDSQEQQEANAEQ